jgi:hypothetical protein
MPPCQPIVPLGRPSEGGLTGSPDVGRCSAKAVPSSPSRRRRRRRSQRPAVRPVPPVLWAAGRGGIVLPAAGRERHRPRLRRPAGRAGQGRGGDMHLPQAARGPLSFTVPSCGAAQGRLPERPKGAVCKTVGYAFPGSNPGPATTSGNGPWPGVSPGLRAVVRCVIIGHPRSRDAAAPTMVTDI